MKNLAKQVVLMAWWCAAVAGCVADELQPTVTIKNENIEQTQSSEGNSDVKVITQTDPKTGKEYEVLKSSFVIKKINISKFGYNNVGIYINDFMILVSYRLLDKKIIFPDGYGTKNIKNLIGERVSFLCKKIKPLNIDNNCDFCISERGEEFLFKNYCDLNYSPEYTINFLIGDM